MKMEFAPPTEIAEQRSAWFKDHAKPGMAFDDAVHLNDEALRLCPLTEAERRLKTERLTTMRELVL